MMRLGDKSIDSIYLGNKVVKEAYIGSNKIWPPVAILTSEDGTITQYFESYADAATYATNNSDTNWNLTIRSGEVPIACFQGITNIISLTLEESVSFIGYDAFKGCTGLTGDLVIPDSVTTIDSWAFQSCTGLTGKLTLGNSVQTMGNEAFRSCGFTGSLTIPSSVTRILSDTFLSCSGFDDDLSYYGKTNPSANNKVFDYTSFTVCKVPTDYEDDNFCGLPVSKVLNAPTNIGVLLSDGIALSYAEALSRSDLNSDNVAGITFECDYFKCIIGLDEYECYFCNGTQTITGDEDNIVITALSSQAAQDFKGKENTDILCKHLTADSTWACNRARNSTILDGEKQGYLMSAGEMYYIFRDAYFDYINTLLEHCGGTPMSSTQSYFASTLNAIDEDGYLSMGWYTNKSSTWGDGYTCGLDGVGVQACFYIRVLYEYD